MKKVFFVVVLFISSFAFASRTWTNLRQFEISDICAIDGLNSVDGKRSDTFYDSILSELKKYQSLYNFELTPNNLETCTLKGVFRFQANRLNDGGYIFFYDLEFYVGSVDATSVKYVGQSKLINGLDFVGLWSTQGSGYSPNISRLNSSLTDAIRQSFEEFVLDWRKAHPKTP